MRSKSISQEVWGFRACWCICGAGFTTFLFFLQWLLYWIHLYFFLQWLLHWIHLFWNGGNRSCNPQRQQTPHSSHFPVTSWLFSASWECFQHHSRHFVGLVVLFMDYSIALKKHGRTTRDHFCFKRYALSWTDEPLPCRGWMLHGHWQRRAHHDSSRRWPRSYYSGRRCTTVNSMQFALILHLYTCVHFSWLWMASYMCIRFYKFFCDRFVCILS